MPELTASGRKLRDKEVHTLILAAAGFLSAYRFEVLNIPLNKYIIPDGDRRIEITEEIEDYILVR